MKKCPVCKTQKLPEAFYRKGTSLAWCCKDCARVLYREKRARNKEGYREKDKRFYNNHREEIIKKRKEWYQKNKHKRYAHEQVKRGLLKGLLVKKSCERCKSKESLAHHPDYSKPLEVIWLCRSCHQLEHIKLDSLNL